VRQIHLINGKMQIILGKEKRTDKDINWSNNNIPIQLIDSMIMIMMMMMMMMILILAVTVAD